MLINLPEDALSIREPFILPGLLMTNTNGRKFCLLFPDPVPSLCMLLWFTSPPPPPPCVSLCMTDGLLTLLRQQRWRSAKVEGVPTGNKVMAKLPCPVLTPKKRMGSNEEKDPCPPGTHHSKPNGHQHEALACFLWVLLLVSLGLRGDSKSP